MKVKIKFRSNLPNDLGRDGDVVEVPDTTQELVAKLVGQGRFTVIKPGVEYCADPEYYVLYFEDDYD